MPDTVGGVSAISDRSGQIGEHRAWIIDPRSPIGDGQDDRDLRRQPSPISELAQHPHPGMRRHTMAIRGHFHRETAAIPIL